VAARLRSSLAAASEREKAMQRSREALRAQMGSVSSRLVGHHLLKNEALANAELYNTLRGPLQEAGSYTGLGSRNNPEARLAGDLQKPASPTRALLVSSGAFLACLVAVVGCFVKESMDNTVRTPDDVKSWIGLRSLALLPSVGTAKPAGSALGRLLRLAVPEREGQEGCTLLEPRSAAAEAVRELRTSLLSAESGQAPAIVLISSSMEGE